MDSTENEKNLKIVVMFHCARIQTPSISLFLHGVPQFPNLSHGPRLCSNHHIHLPIGKEEKRKEVGILVIYCSVTTLKIRGLK